MAQLQQRLKRHARLVNDLHLVGADLGHPRRNGHSRPIGPPDDVTRLVVDVVQPDYRKALTRKRVEAVAHHDFT
jgi:hypothetical protein